jgi:hypothetical protein
MLGINLEDSGSPSISESRIDIGSLVENNSEEVFIPSPNLTRSLAPSPELNMIRLSPESNDNIPSTSGFSIGSNASSSLITAPSIHVPSSFIPNTLPEVIQSPYVTRSLISPGLISETNSSGPFSSLSDSDLAPEFRSRIIRGEGALRPRPQLITSGRFDTILSGGGSTNLPTNLPLGSHGIEANSTFTRYLAPPVPSAPIRPAAFEPYGSYRATGPMLERIDRNGIR